MYSGEKISAQEGRELIDSHEVVLLDVRRQDEFEQAHIPGAVLLTLDNITAETASAAIPDKQTPVIVYCRTGVRSAEAARILADLGYETVYDMGGIVSWPYETVSGA